MFTDKTIRIEYTEDFHCLVVHCNGMRLLESGALPSVNETKNATCVELNNCPLPAGENATLRHLLNELNVALELKPGNADGDTPLKNLSLRNLPAKSALAAHHFIGLEDLVALVIEGSYKAPVRPKTGFLSLLQNLYRLSTLYVYLQPADLSNITPNIRILELRQAAVKFDSLRSFNNLIYLNLETEDELSLKELPLKLESLELSSPATNFNLHEIRTPNKLTLAGWTENITKPLTQCDALSELLLNFPALEILSADWLANCSQLKSLTIRYAQNLITLDPNVFRGAYALEQLTINTNKVLKSLPSELLHHASKLKSLNLNKNALQNFPR